MSKNHVFSVTSLEMGVAEPYSELLNIIPSKDEYTSVQLNLVNPTLADVSFTLFDGYSIIPVPTFRLPIPFPPFFISGSIGYNFFIRGFAASPLEVRQINISTESVEQMTIPFNLTYKDANGIQCNNIRLPNIYVSQNQYQGLNSYVDFKPKELILDNQTTISNYTVKANSQVTLVIYYRQVTKASILSDKTDLCDRVDLNKYKPNNRKESQLRLQSMNKTFLPFTLENEFSFLNKK